MSYRDGIVKHLSEYRIKHFGFLDKGPWDRISRSIVCKEQFNKS